MSWTRIQSASGHAFGTSVTATFSAANVSSGNKIIVAVGSSWRDPPSSVQDGASNNWTLLGSKLPASNGGSVWLYGLDVPAGDAGTKPTITVTFPSSNGQSVIIQEVSGLLPGNTSAMIDGTAAGLSGTGSSTGSPSYTSTAANEYLVCCYGDANSAATLVAGGGLTLDPNNTATQSFASIEYGNSTGGAETTGFTGASTGQWSVLTVAFQLPAVASVATYSPPPPAILAHPTFARVVLEEAWQRADWQAQGVADLTVSFASTSGGVDTYNTLSPWNGGGSTPATQQMRVLRPVSPNPDFPHAFLIMLPVDAGQGTSFGDTIAVAQAISANDAWNLTIVQPGYQGAVGGSVGPWFADNPLDPTISQEKFTLLITAWIKKNLATTGQEQVYLIGFSRSGTAAQFLQFRHPYLFAAAASWDAGFMMTDYDGTDPYQTVGGSPSAIYGTSANFQANYRLDTRLAGYQATGQYGVNRIWIGQGPDFQDTPHYDTALTAAGIPHTYTFSNTVESHAWHNDWVAAALQAIIPSNAPTMLPQQVISHPLYLQLLEVAERRMTSGITALGPVSGVHASLDIAAPGGTVSAGVVITGTAAGLTLAAPAGSVAAGAVIAGGTAALTLAVPSDESVSSGDTIPGAAALLPLAAPAGTVSAGATITGTVAALTLAAPPGSVSTGAGPAGVPATLTLAAPAGTVSAGATITGTVAALTLAAPPGVAVPPGAASPSLILVFFP